MVAEKVAASRESVTGMALSATAAWQSMWMNSMFCGRAPTAAKMQRVATSVLATGMEPYEKAVRSNVKRLIK